ncbi:MAG: hypothetical protein H0W88_04845 [Parachlamydiaceae bacterium]|nr:hypothetical protein [Parachlamydiaceae bacterium]
MQIIRQPLSHIHQYCSSGYKHSHAALCSTLSGLNNIRENAEAFQKVCQIAICTIQSINWATGKNYLPKFLKILDIVNVHDFYEIVELPDRLYFQLSYETVDHDKLLNSLEATLCLNWKLEDKNDFNKERDESIKQFARHSLNDFLEHISDEDITYRYPEQLKKDLKKWLIHDLNFHELKDCNPAKVNFTKLEIPLKKLPILDFLSKCCFTVTTIGWVPSFLQSWGVIDLSFVTNAMGRYKALKWLSGQSLDKWLTAGLCLAYVFKFIESSRILRQNSSSPNDKSMARWDAVTSATEFIFNFTIIKNVTQTFIVFSMLIAKSIGLFSIMWKPSPQFFEDRER